MLSADSRRAEEKRLIDERRDGSSIVAGSVYVSSSKDVGCFKQSPS